jgi:hypothetical protein
MGWRRSADGREGDLLRSIRVNPADLEGDALRRWYLRSPDEIARERAVEHEARSTVFFKGAVKPSLSNMAADAPRSSGGDDELWIATGAGGFRRIAPNRREDVFPEDREPAFLPSGPAAPESGELFDIGNPSNPDLRDEWERVYGRPWPRRPDGTRYDVAHIRAIADGGLNTVENIRPLPHPEHVESHKDDASRWGKRPSIAAAFGGRVEPRTAPRFRPPKVNGLGVLGLIPNLTGILSGRIRTDTPVHFWYDMIGQPAPDDPLPPVPGI